MNDLISISEAAEILNVSLFKMRDIIKQQNLETVTNPVDNRERLVSRVEIEKLKAVSKTKARRSGNYVPTSEERAMLLEALADEEAEDRENSIITLEDIEKMVLEMIENHRKQHPAQSA